MLVLALRPANEKKIYSGGSPEGFAWSRENKAFPLEIYG